MYTMIRHAALAAVVGLAAATTVQAGSTTTAVLGGALGAATGVVIGDGLGGRDGAIVGGALGGAVGAALGSATGHHHHHHGYYVAPPRPVHHVHFVPVGAKHVPPGHRIGGPHGHRKWR